MDLNRGPFFVIAGPCVIESLELCLRVGAHVKGVCDRIGLSYIFKASFDKANRSSNSSFRGPGVEEGLVVLERVRRELGVPVLTDVHEPDQAAIAAPVVDVLQVPAFLARQTDLLVACAQTGKAVNIKKGQFMSPQEMGNAVEKVRTARGETRSESGGSGSGQSAAGLSALPKPETRNPKYDLFLTERGTFFGYNRLVNDFTGLSVMKSFNCPVVFDITHSTQQPAGLGNQSGGNPQYSPLLARAAIATGCVDGLFLECHPDPRNAKSDAATMLHLTDVEPLLIDCKRIAEVIRSAR
jgi:2-dehydro-3-deoxyphosphooctonate aldolase (KDO 8-P synthase)